MAEYRLLRISATLLLVGVVLTLAAQIPHPNGSSAANLEQFAAYAATSVEFYSAVHLAQFAGEATFLIWLWFYFSRSTHGRECRV